jgi:histidine triad (HIT) family protein
MVSDTVQCPFCSILAGDKPAHVVWRGREAMAFLDQRPLFPGHVLVVPTAHVQTLGELDAGQSAPLMAVVQAASRAMESALGAQGSFVAVNNRVSQSVPHLHVHVVPRSKGDGLKGFFWPRHDYADDAERDRTAATLAEAIAAEMDAG